MRRLSVAVAGFVLALGGVAHVGTSATAPKPPSNDTLAGAALISSWPTTIRGSASGATRDASDPDCANEDSTVWYRIQPTVNGRFVATLRFLRSYGDVCVLVRAGGGLHEVGQLLGEPDLGDPQSVAFDAIAGSSYYVMIGLFILPGRDGQFTLTLKGGESVVPTWPADIAVGPDGALWFTTSHGGASIGRITTTGHITRYTSPTIRGPGAIAVGPDGALWFTDSHSIGRVTTHGKITTYPDKRLIGPVAITAGDGAVWFTDYNVDSGEGGSIGRISMAGTIRLYTDPRINAPEGITRGPDGAIWFTNAAGGSIGRISKTGSISFVTDRRIVSPEAITAGPDGALWFTSGETNSIGRITVAGALRIYRAPSIKWPAGITAGPDNALWFANFDGRSIGRISVSGTIRTYTASSISEPFKITTAVNGTIWFTDGNGSIGRISKTGAVGSFPPPAKR